MRYSPGSRRVRSEAGIRLPGVCAADRDGAIAALPTYPSSSRMPRMAVSMSAMVL